MCERFFCLDVNHTRFSTNQIHWCPLTPLPTKTGKNYQIYSCSYSVRKVHLGYHFYPVQVSIMIHNRHDKVHIIQSFIFKLERLVIFHCKLYVLSFHVKHSTKRTYDLYNRTTIPFSIHWVTWGFFRNYSCFSSLCIQIIQSLFIASCSIFVPSLYVQDIIHWFIFGWTKGKILWVEWGIYWVF